MNGACWGEDGGCDRGRDVGCCGIVLTVLCGVFLFVVVFFSLIVSSVFVISRSFMIEDSFNGFAMVVI